MSNVAFVDKDQLGQDDHGTCEMSENSRESKAMQMFLGRFKRTNLKKSSCFTTKNVTIL